MQNARDSMGRKNNYKEKLDALTNVSFLHPDAIQLYTTILKDSASECVLILDSKEHNNFNKSQVGIVLDYLMIEH